MSDRLIQAKIDLLESELIMLLMDVRFEEIKAKAKELVNYCASQRMEGFSAKSVSKLLEDKGIKNIYVELAACELSGDLEHQWSDYNPYEGEGDGY